MEPCVFSQVLQGKQMNTHIINPDKHTKKKSHFMSKFKYVINQLKNGDQACYIRLQTKGAFGDDGLSRDVGDDDEEE